MIKNPVRHLCENAESGVAGSCRWEYWGKHKVNRWKREIFFNILAVRKMSGWMKQVPACLLCPYPRAFMRTDQITPEIKVNLQWLVSPQKSIWTSFFFFKFFKCFQLLKCQASTFLFQMCDRKLYPDFFTFFMTFDNQSKSSIKQEVNGQINP